MAAPSGDDDADEGDWQYSLADLEDDEESAPTGDSDSEREEEPDERIDRSIEPESIDPENALFVVLGAIVAVLILLRTAAVFGA